MITTRKRVGAETFSPRKVMICPSTCGAGPMLTRRGTTPRATAAQSSGANAASSLESSHQAEPKPCVTNLYGSAPENLVGPNDVEDGVGGRRLFECAQRGFGLLTGCLELGGGTGDDRSGGDRCILLWFPWLAPDADHSLLCL